MFSEDQITDLTMELDAIVDLTNATQKILKEEEVANDIIPLDNVVYMDFSILNEFEKLLKTQLHLPQILAVYHDWAERTFRLATKNRGRLKKGNLRNHVEQCLSQIATIRLLLPEVPPANPM